MEEIKDGMPDEQQVLELGIMRGQRRAFGTVAGRFSAAPAECLRKIREEIVYLKFAANWAGFCEGHLKISKHTADRAIALLRKHGTSAPGTEPPRCRVFKYRRLTRARNCWKVCEMPLARFLAILALCLDANAAISLVAHKINKDLTGAEITALAAPGYNSTAGNLIAVWVVSYSGGQPTGTVTDSAGDTFTAATLQKGAWFGQWFYARNVKGDPFNVVTIHPTTTGRATFIYVGISVLEYSGADKASPLMLDVAGNQGSLNGVWTSGNINIAAGELVLLGIVTGYGGAYTPGAGFKIEDAYLTPSSSKFSFGVMDQIFANTQSGVTASVTWTGTLQATGAVVSFKPAGAN